ncbi:MAG: Nucleoside-diphosphate-sugar epimerase [Gammaproteobacteria bacterium]|nr:Nucleoside-diphosphate-sugar epimerase [Gammaproteobacteria bacterium]
MTVTVGIVGLGFSGRTIHAPLIRAAGMRIEAVVTGHPELARMICPDARVFGDVTAMLEGSAIDLAVIATPNHLHVEQATACLRSGRHVVIDKPAAVDSRALDELIEAAATYDRKVAVFHNRRWDSDFLTAARLLQARTLGEISAFESRWDRFRPNVPARWRESRDSGGGILLDLGSHLLDQALRLFGRPRWVQAVLMAQRSGATVDDAFEILMVKDSTLIKLGASSLAAAAAPRFRVNGTQGTFLKCGLDVQEQQLRDGVDPLAIGFGDEPPVQFGTLIAAGGTGSEPVAAERGRWLEFYRLMRASIENGDPVPVSLDEVREVAEILDAARRSSSEGRRVELPATGPPSPR